MTTSIIYAVKKCFRKLVCRRINGKSSQPIVRAKIIIIGAKNEIISRIIMNYIPLFSMIDVHICLLKCLSPLADLSLSRK